jgi:hypothetical protein
MERTPKDLSAAPDFNNAAGVYHCDTISESWKQRRIVADYENRRAVLPPHLRHERHNLRSKN